MLMPSRKYDSTIARIAGNILSGQEALGPLDPDGQLFPRDQKSLQWAVVMARAVAAEIERTEPSTRLLAGKVAAQTLTAVCEMQASGLSDLDIVDQLTKMFEDLFTR
jgi:hypothetical protein